MSYNYVNTFLKLGAESCSYNFDENQKCKDLT